jgi:hypothetical protein
MIVHNLNISGVAFDPMEADAILIINSNAMLAFSIPLQFLQPISGRSSQIIDIYRRINHEQLSISQPMQIWRKPLGEFPIEYFLRIFAAKGFNHE